MAKARSKKKTRKQKDRVIGYLYVDLRNPKFPPMFSEYGGDIIDYVNFENNDDNQLDLIIKIWLNPNTLEISYSTHVVSARDFTDPFKGIE